MAALVRAWGLDAVVVAGIALVGYGAGEFQAGLAPIVWGAGLIAAVRLGKS